MRVREDRVSPSGTELGKELPVLSLMAMLGAFSVPEASVQQRLFNFCWLYPCDGDLTTPLVA